MRSVPVEPSVQNDGTRLIPGTRVTCATCGTIGTINSNRLSHQLPPEVAERKFRQKGWEFRGGRAYCPEHARHAPPKAIKDVRLGLPPGIVVNPPFQPQPKEENMATNPNVTPIRTLADLGEASIERMSASDHRRIFRAVDEHWDENVNRYIGAAGDQALATKLGVPRAWVEHVRRESFGENGGSDELEDVKKAVIDAMKLIDPLVKDAEQKLDAAVEALGKVKDLQVGLKGMLRRVEKVEQAVAPKR